MIPKVPIAGHSQVLGIIAALLNERGDRMSPTECLRLISAKRNGADPGKLPEGLTEAYLDRLHAAGLRDLDDILEEALNADVSGEKRFRNLLVDEYQDINAAQRKLVAHWISGGGSLFVIGDPDQSIYGFRGANAACFDELKEMLPELRTITLVRNYRSTPEILSAAMNVISRNPGKNRLLVPARKSDRSVRLITCPDAVSEGHMIAREISRMAGGVDMINSSGMEESRAFSDIAVICRSRYQLARIESCLAQEGIPCAVVGMDDSIADVKSQGALAFLRWLLDETDASAQETALENLWNGDTASMLQVRDIFAGKVRREKPHKLFSDLSNVTGNDFGALGSIALFYKTIAQLTHELETGEECDIRRISGNYASGAVTLMTMHGSKGLEYPAVFLAGCTKGEFPSEMAADIREERRLFFVGMTRARDELIISTGGRGSSFIDELPEGIQHESAKAHRSIPQYEQLSFL